MAMTAATVRAVAAVRQFDSAEVATHGTRLAEEQPPRLEVHHLAGWDVVLLPVHDDETTGGDDGHPAAEAARTLHPTIGLVVVEHDTGKAAVVSPA